MTVELSTQTIIAQARAFQKSLLPDAFIGDSSPATECARKVTRAMIDGALFRDLNTAMTNAGVASLCSGGWVDESRKTPTRYTEQSDWRDYSGYLCATEYMAVWVAAWIARYLDPRDADGNPSTGRVNKIVIEGKPDQWLAVTGSYKVSD